MSGYYSDTDVQVEAQQFEMLRHKPAWRKLEMMAELNAAARMLALGGLRQRYPGIDESDLRFKLAAMLYGEQIAQKAYGG